MQHAALTSLLAQTAPEHGWVGSWSPGIGDPTPFGWFTTVAYFVAAYLCWRTYLATPVSKPRGLTGHLGSLRPILLSLVAPRRVVLAVPERQRIATLWLGFAITLFLLGINKQLDLQTAFTEVGRLVAHDEGWYAARRRVQVAFILGVLLAGLWVFAALVRLASGSRGRMAAALTGTVFTMVFVLIRAASFHHVDLLLGVSLGGLKLNWIIELGGIFLVAYGASRRPGWPPSEPVTSPVPTDRRASRRS
jgi:hypothetical protein